MKFTSDPVKAAENLRKHGVDFELAEEVFEDPRVVIVKDRVEDGEQRWHAIGIVRGVLVLPVVHTVEDENNEYHRLISAREADRYEKRIYAHDGENN